MLLVFTIWLLITDSFSIPTQDPSIKAVNPILMYKIYLALK